MPAASGPLPYNSMGYRQIIVGKGVRPHHPLILPSHLNPLMQAIPIHPIRPTSYPQVFDERSIHQVLLLPIQDHPSTLNPTPIRIVGGVGWACSEHGYVCRNRYYIFLGAETDSLLPLWGPSPLIK